MLCPSSRTGLKRFTLALQNSLSLDVGLGAEGRKGKPISMLDFAESK